MLNRNFLDCFIILLLVLIVNIFAYIFNFRIDLTKDKVHSISDKSISIINDLSDNVFVKIYLEGDFPSEFKHLQSELINLMNSFKSISSENFDFEFIDPNKYNDKNERNTFFKKLVKDGLQPTDLEIKTVSGESRQILFPGAVIYFKDKQIAVNFLNSDAFQTPEVKINKSIENLEFNFISAIQHITRKKIKKIAFLRGNGELNSNQLYDLRESVLNNNYNLNFYYQVDDFNIKEFELDSLTMQADISKQIAKILEYKVLIIAKPTVPFNMLDKFIIDQYIMNGGRVLWLIDGAMANIDSLKTNNSFISFKNDLNIDDQLFKYGVRINNDLVEDLRSAQIPIITGYSNNLPQQSFFPWPYYPLLFSFEKHPISNGLDAIKCEFVSSLDTIKNSIRKTILLTTSKNSRTSYLPSKISFAIVKNPPPKKSYNKSYVPIAVLLEGEFESVFNNRIVPKLESINFTKYSDNNKMIVVADGDIARSKVSKNDNIFPLGYDKYIKYTYKGNKIFLMNAIHYLCDDVFLSKLKSKQIKLRLLDQEKIEKNKFIIQIINILLPIMFIIIVTLFYIRIKRINYE